MTRSADLHIHTHFSDSTSSPEEVIEQAHEQGLACIAIADHDTIEGIEPTVEAGKKYGIEVISAIELSSEINGVDVVHWTLSKEDMEKCLPPEELDDMGELTQATGDLYIAEDDNFVVLMEMSFEGEDLDMDLGDGDEEAKAVRMEIRYETTDVNEPFTIEVPAEAAESSSLPDDIPVPEGATGINNMFGMISFTAETPPEEVFTFFQEEMPNNGWTETSADAMSGLWMLEYTKDGRTASIMISEDDSGNASVMITVADE